MNELYLSLAGIRVRVTAEAFGPMEFLKDYITQPCLPDHSFRAELTERIEPPMGELICDQPAFRVYRDGDSILRDVGTAGNAYLRTVRQGRDGVLSFRRDQMPQGITGKQLLNAMDLPHLLTIHDGFLLHASYIEW